MLTDAKESPSAYEPMCISVVSPVYQAEDIIVELVDHISNSLNSIRASFEVILVDDRSTDGSWSSIKKACIMYPNIQGIRLSKNFGQHAAIMAGLHIARGDWVVVMDCDLQDQPSEIKYLLEKALEGYDIVLAKRVARQDSSLKKIYSKLFYALFSFLTSAKQDPSIANFGIYKINVVRAILSMGDSMPFLPAMVHWVGFKSASINVRHCSRKRGKSAYSLRRMIALATNNILFFSEKPLRLAAQSGLILALSSLAIGVFYLAGSLVGSIQVQGYPSIIISIWFTAGINIMVLGLVGLYVGKAFQQIKNRPIYIVDEAVGSSHR